MKNKGNPLKGEITFSEDDGTTPPPWPFSEAETRRLERVLSTSSVKRSSMGSLADILPREKKKAT